MSGVPSTPPSRPPTVSHSSSPVKNVGKLYAEHLRDQVQAFGYDKEVHELAPMNLVRDFFQFLGVPTRHLPTKYPTAPESVFSRDNFVLAANTMSKAMKDKHFPTKSLLVFKETGNTVHHGHVTDTQCKPDYTAAFEDDWKEDDTTLWPCIQLAGEDASKGKSREDQKTQAISYLHYLLLARPDLHVAQGLLTTDSGVIFLFGIGGSGIRSFQIFWDRKTFYRFMYAFVYRLYQPGNFADPAYFKVVPDLVSDSVTYTLRITVPVNVDGIETEEQRDFPGFYPIYASSPFETRTHILSNPSSEIEVDGKVLTVFKDQLCRRGTRFDEYTILSHIHDSEEVPGVVEAVYHKSFHLPRFLDTSREKHRLGLRQSGSPFTSIPTLRQVLETVFDVLEVLRYLRSERKVLHRDISKGNVLFLKDVVTPRTTTTPDAEPIGATNIPPKEIPICFINYLLKKSKDPRETSALLIDFNYAEYLESKQEEQHKRISRTGTPAFIARAVEQGAAMPLPQGISLLPPVPDSPEPYSTNHPDRIKKFPFADEKTFRRPSSDSNGRPWRHELDHDAESVFWLLLYWLLAAQPAQYSKEDIDFSIWSTFTGSAVRRSGLLLSLASGLSQDLTHSLYQPTWPLVSSLAAVLIVDRYWIDESDVRNDPEYINEAFQRIILQFILENQNGEFMDQEVDTSFRRLEVIPQVLGKASTSSQQKDADNRILKRRRLDVQQEDADAREVWNVDEADDEANFVNDNDDDENMDL